MYLYVYGFTHVFTYLSGGDQCFLGSMDGDLRVCKSGDTNYMSYENARLEVKRVWHVGSSWEFGWNPVCVVSAADGVTVHAANNLRLTETQDLTGNTTLSSSDLLSLGRSFLNDSSKLSFC